MSKTLSTISIFFLSGVAGLIYEVLWMKQLGLLFGSTAHSAAAATAAFFLGIAAGSYFWGRRLTGLSQPLKLYGWLELGIAATAIFFFAMYAVWDLLFPHFYAAFGTFPTALTLLKLLIAMLLICPASFLMGGTLPVMGQYLIRESRNLSQWAGWLYGINTFGAAVGAIAAGFFLPRLLGFTLSYAIALALSTFVGLVALYLSRSESALPPIGRPKPQEKSTASENNRLSKLLVLIAFLSGFVSLGLQVLWTRMFEQVLQNSVYTFASILVVFLLALALGAIISRYLAGKPWQPMKVLSLLLLCSGILVILLPTAFNQWSSGLRYSGGNETLIKYLLTISTSMVFLVGVPTTTMGTIFPYLYKLAEANRSQPGKLLGILSSWNTLGAVLGSLAAGFFLLEWLGLWNSIHALGFAYLAMALVLYWRHADRLSTAWAALPLSAVFLGAALIQTTHLPVVRLQESRGGETLLEVWEGSAGTVAVVEREGVRRVKLNNWYALGGSGAVEMERMQTHLPMHLHPKAKSVFYLGLGSGITAGAAMNYPVERVVIAELVPDVITASRRYFVEHANGLFNDERVSVVHEDGRNFLRATREQFDLVIGDLFVPWKSGVGYLYTKEHFSAAKARLRTGGLFAQWIPLYQLSERELLIIAKTMAEVFPQTTLWRGDYYPEKPMLALVGHTDSLPLALETPMVQASQLALNAYRAGRSETVPLLAHYLGRLTQDDPMLSASLLSTDDRPWIEYLAPQAHRAEKAGQITWLVGEEYLNLMTQLKRRWAKLEGSYLSGVPSALRRTVTAGYYFHRSQIARAVQNQTEFEASLAEGRRLLLAQQDVQQPSL
ncbi:MAG: fused MFS/spermidine synthase [Pseudomonadota bacterium]